MKSMIHGRQHDERRRYDRSLLGERLEERTVLSSWTAQIGWAGDDRVATGSVMDAAGNMYLLGTFQGTADFDPGPGVFPMTSAGDSDGFLGKYAADGSFLWARRFGGSSYDGGTEIALGPGETDVVVTGSVTGSADFEGVVVPGGADQMAFVWKVSASGSTSWAQTVRGTKSGALSIGNAVAVGDDGSIYVAGDFNKSCDFNPGSGTFTMTTPSKGTIAGYYPYDAFVWKLTANGTFANAWRIGGKDDDRGEDIVVEGSSFYLLGDFRQTVDLDPSAGNTTRTSAGGWDFFYGRYSATDGSLQWVQTIGNLGHNSAFGMTADATSLYITARLFDDGLSNPNSNPPLDVDPGTGTTSFTSNGSFDGLLIKYSKDGGGFVWARQFGGTGWDSVSSNVVIDSLSDAVYVGGYFTGTVDFDPDSAAGELSSVGGLDGYLVKLGTDGAWQNSWRMGGLLDDRGVVPIGLAGSTIHFCIAFEDTANFPTGDTLTSQGSYDIALVALDQSELLPATSPASAASSVTLAGTSPSAFDTALIGLLDYLNSSENLRRKRR